MIKIRQKITLKLFVLLLYGFGFVLVACAPGAKPAPILSILLTPAAPDAEGNILYLDVEVTAEAANETALFHMPLVLSNVKTSADAVQELEIVDSKGAIGVTINDDPQSESAPFRHWQGERVVSGKLSIRYRVPITNAFNPLGAAPPYELRTEDGGFSGLGGAFLMLPKNAEEYRLAVRWNFAAIGDGANGVSTLGVGDVTADRLGRAADFFDMFFMGGLTQHYPDPLPAMGFASSWQGEPPFDAKALMKWMQKLYDHDLKFFREQGESSYAVFLRRNLVNAGGGVEVERSFVGTFDDRTKVEDFQLTLSHEMVHTFVGALDAPKGLEGSWFSEGLAVYYQRLLPWRAGLISADAYLADLNQTAARYYTDILNDTPNDKIAALFWADTRVRVLPYDRGAMYFAALNERIEKASRGKRTLDDLVLAMLARRRAGQTADKETWLSLVTGELGDAARVEFEQMMAGGLVLPASDAFGPCFERTQAPLRRYELGFDSMVLIEPQRIVRRLINGSAAELAGLRNGDAIVKPVPQDALQADQNATLTLLVQRGDKQLSITYLPRGETIQTFQWKKVEGMPTCAE